MLVPKTKRGQNISDYSNSPTTVSTRSKSKERKNKREKGKEPNPSYNYIHHPSKSQAISSIDEKLIYRLNLDKEPDIDPEYEHESL